jgi:large subunit ribosomal protein L6
MSRIGKNPVMIPQGVEVSVNGQTVKVKGKLGEQSIEIHDDVTVSMEEIEGKKAVRLKAANDSPMALKIWPTMRVLVKNMIIGVSEGYTKKMDIKGVGYRANLQGTDLVLQLGYSHEIRYKIPAGIKVAVADQVGLTVTGIDKQLVGQVAANIRSYRPPEPYKGKGIRYTDEYVLRKEGKKK